MNYPNYAAMNARPKIFEALQQARHNQRRAIIDQEPSVVFEIEGQIAGLVIALRALAAES